MSVYTTKSTKQAIAEIINKCKLTDATYADDILLSVHEAMKALRVRGTLKPQWKKLEVKDHCVELPCGLVYLDAVAYNGGRLRQGLGVTDTRLSPFKKRFTEEELAQYFDNVDSEEYQNSLSYLGLRGEAIQMEKEGSSSGAYYIPFPNHLQTSFECGCIYIYYRIMPVDDNGYPMIPDEYNHQQALYWNAMAYLQQGGYKHNDPKMNDFDYCDQKFQMYTRRGKNKVKYPSIDKRESIMQSTVNLIPPRGYYESFFINSESPKYVNK